MTRESVSWSTRAAAAVEAGRTGLVAAWCGFAGSGVVVELVPGVVACSRPCVVAWLCPSRVLFLASETFAPWRGVRVVPESGND